MISVFAPAGIQEIRAGADLATIIAGAVADDPAGPLAEGDIVVVTSKIVSKAAGRTLPAGDRSAAIEAETFDVVAWRGDTVIARTRTGLVLAAAGVDNSNVDPGVVLLLPEDPDASAAALRTGLAGLTGLSVGVIISDTAGRAWRIGQTDQAIGAAGLRVTEPYEGRTDPYGNVLEVTEMAVADEIAAAADLVKGKLSGRPVAVVRGLAQHVRAGDGPDTSAASLLRPRELDMFGFGSREAVLAALLTALGRPEDYRRLVALSGPALVEAVVAMAPPDWAELTRRLLRAAGRPLPEDVRALDRPG